MIIWENPLLELAQTKKLSEGVDSSNKLSFYVGFTQQVEGKCYNSKFKTKKTVLNFFASSREIFHTGTYFYNAIFQISRATQKLWIKTSAEKYSPCEKPTHYSPLVRF